MENEINNEKKEKKNKKKLKKEQKENSTTNERVNEWKNEIHSITPESNVDVDSTCLNCCWCRCIFRFVVRMLCGNLVEIYTYRFLYIYIWERGDTKMRCANGMALDVRVRHKAKQVIKTTDGHRMKNVNRMACQRETETKRTACWSAEFQLDEWVDGWRKHVYTWINVLAHIRQRHEINADIRHWAESDRRRKHVW